MVSIPCTASGTNAIALTPNVNCPALTGYNELGGYRFVAVSTSTGLVTAQYNGLGFLPVYHGDGVTQASTADLVIGQQYIFTFHAALNGGVGGFYFESPSQPVAVSTWFKPGGRLTMNAGVPVNFTSGAPSSNLYYAPYVHPFVPIFNGSSVQMYQFASSLNDHLGLLINLNASASWPNGIVADVFVILNAGVLTLATLQWSTPSVRAMTLSVFGGFLTNSGATNMLISPAGVVSTVAVAANQATFLGSFFTSGPGLVPWQFPAAATAGSFGVCNYYNQALFTGFVTDNAASYTYTTNTYRQAGSHAYNSISMVQTSSERAVTLTYAVSGQILGVAGAFEQFGIGVNSTTASGVAPLVVTNPSASALTFAAAVNSLSFSITGFFNATANETGDGTHANTFNFLNINQFGFEAWL
jgi:hypothetical protein